ncbi:MAG: hypothetical protein ACYC67_25410 [Prosthecobacter sp.]|jgi:hypothetical protein
MKRSWGFGLAVFAGLFLGALVLAEQPVPRKKYDIEFSPWTPVNVNAVTKEGRTSIAGQRAEVKVRMLPGEEVITYPFVCWREAQSGILCFGRESRFYVCLEDRVIGIPQESIERSVCLEIYERKVALEDFTKVRDELQAMEVFSARSFLDYKECLDLNAAVGAKFVHPTNTSEIKKVTIDEVTLAGEEMTLHLINYVGNKEQATFSARTLKPVRAQVEGAK